MNTPGNSSDDQVRALLSDAVADVQPRRGLDEIRSRTTSSRSRRPWAWGAGGAVLATAATIAAVVVLTGVPGTTEAGPGPAGGASSGATGPGTVSTEPSMQPTLRVYFVGDSRGGPRLFRELHTEPPGHLSIDVAVEEAVNGTAQDPDYRSGWPQGTTFQRAQVSDGVLSVDLSGAVVERPSGMSRAEAELALQQLVFTAQSAVQVTTPVTFLVDGAATATLLGVPTDQPVERASDDDVLAPVSIAAPSDGASVDSPFSVTGEAASFEANVQWELKRGDTVVTRGFTTAEECCTLSPYAFEVTAPPGDYTLVVHDEDASGGAGLPPSQDTKDVTVG